MIVIARNRTYLRGAAVRIVIAVFVYVPPSGSIPSEISVQRLAQNLTGPAVCVPCAVAYDIFAVRPFDLIRTVSRTVEYIAAAVIISFAFSRRI